MTRFAILAAAGATTLSLAACGSSQTAAPPQSAGPTNASSAPAPAPTQAPAPGQGQRVAGLIASVAGDTVQVTQKNGTASVDFTPSTKINEVTSAGLPDVTTGSCVSVRPARDNPQNGNTITAGSVRISPAVDGKCPQPKEPPAGSTPPAPSGRPSPEPGKNPGINGTVASVAGNTVTVNGADSTSPTTVTVTDKTRYTKLAGATSQAITQGKCITANGTAGSGGALQATTIDLRSAHDGKCPGEGGPHRGHGG